MLKRFMFTAFAVLFAGNVFAQDYDQATLEKWFDGVLNELKTAGAKQASRGALSFDPATGQLSLSDVKAQFDVTEEKEVTSTEAKGKTKTAKKTETTSFVLSIARISASKLTQAGGGMWNAENVVLENIQFSVIGEDGAATIDRLALANISSPQIEAGMLAKNPGEQLASIISSSSFKSLVINEQALIVSEKKGEDFSFKLKDMRIDDFTKGIAKSFTLAGGAGSGTAHDSGKTEAVKINIEPAQMENIDFGLYADFMTAKPKRAGQKNQLLYSLAKFGGFGMTVGTDTEISLGSGYSKNAKMDVPQKGLGAMWAIALDETKGNSNDDEKELLSLVKDWYGISSTEYAEVNSFKVRSAEGDVLLKKVVAKEFGKNLKELNAEGLTFNSAEVKGGLERFTLRDLNSLDFYNAVFEAMEKNADVPDFKKLEGKMPTIGLFEVVNFIAQSKGEPELHIGHISFTLESWTKFVPNLVKLSFSDIVIPQEAMEDLESPNLKDLGYQKIDASSDMVFKLMQADKKLAFKPMTLNLGEVGAMSSEFSLSGIDETMLGYEGLTNKNKFGKALFERFSLRIDNGSFLDRYFSWKAKVSKKSVDSLRTEMATMLKASTFFISDSADQEKASVAIDAFMKNSKNLTVTITPKEPISLLELQGDAMGNPMSILQKININISANEGS